jgi:hypothetical protein
MHYNFNILIFDKNKRKWKHQDGGQHSQRSEQASTSNKGLVATNEAGSRNASPNLEPMKLKQVITRSQKVQIHPQINMIIVANLSQLVDVSKAD